MGGQGAALARVVMAEDIFRAATTADGRADAGGREGGGVSGEEAEL